MSRFAASTWASIWLMAEGIDQNRRPVSLDPVEQGVGGGLILEEHRRGADRERKEEIGPHRIPEIELGDSNGDVLCGQPESAFPYNSVVLANDQWVCTTALGRPVVPPEKIHRAGSRAAVSKVGTSRSGRTKSPSTTTSDGGMGSQPR